MGEVIAGRFELLEHIATGGSGSVFRARDLAQHRLCAAKVMRQSYSGEILRFVREQGVKFDHRHLLTPYGWAAVDDRVVIATRLMAGGNLSAALSDHGAFSAELVAEVLTQLLDGLAHVHAAGWVHRDIKPANVLLEPTGTGVPQLRLADFGIASHADQPRLTESGLVVGTPGFLAPELLRLPVEPAAAQDLYAAGVLAVQLLHPELRGEALSEHCRALQTEGLPAALYGILRGLLDTNPELRHRAAAVAAEQLAPLRNARGYMVASGEPFEVFDHFALPDAEPEPIEQSPAEEPAPSTMVRRAPNSRRRALPWAPLLALLAAVLLGVLSLWLVFGQAGQGAPSQDSVTSSPPTLDEQSMQPPATKESAGTTGSAPTERESEAVTSTSSTPRELGVELDSTAVEGQACTVLEAGLQVNGADGQTLVCRDGVWRS
ncbi:serine/threonine-protein kinase [Glutamicibacter endophyticus]